MSMSGRAKNLVSNVQPTTTLYTIRVAVVVAMREKDTEHAGMKKPLRCSTSKRVL